MGPYTEMAPGLPNKQWTILETRIMKAENGKSGISPATAQSPRRKSDSERGVLGVLARVISVSEL